MDESCHCTIMILGTGLLFLCLIHLSFNKEIVETVSINITSSQPVAVSNYGMDTTKIRIPIPCCGLFSVFLTGFLNGSLNTTHFEICSTPSCALASEYVKQDGTDVYYDNLKCGLPSDIWLNKTASGVISFGIQSFLTTLPYDRFCAVNIEVASDACTSWTFQKSMCSKGTYGEKCELPCGHCLGEACEVYTGECSKDCDVGWIGPNCTEDSPDCNPTPLIERTDTTNGYFKKEPGIQIITLNQIGSTTQCTNLRCALSCLMHSWCWYYHFDNTNTSCQACVLFDSTIRPWLWTGPVDDHLHRWVAT